MIWLVMVIWVGVCLQAWVIHRINERQALISRRQMVDFEFLVHILKTQQDVVDNLWPDRRRRDYDKKTRAILGQYKENS